MEWFLAALKKYAEFEGRARRKEYWFFILFEVLILIVLFILSIILGQVSSILGTIFGLLYFAASLGLLVPALAVGVRRLHDTGRSGWWLLIAFVPLVSIALIVFMCFDSEPGDNQYGPNPKAGEVSA
jgi:uncharacterized membrane protein YhaH (DUF805 family)